MLQTLQLFGESCHLLELSMNPCSQGCSYCVKAGTMILMADFTEKPIEEVKIGDEILAFEENVVSGEKTRHYKKAKVIKLFNPRKVNELYELDYGRKISITGEHPVLTRRGWNKVEKIFQSNDKDVSRVITSKIPVLDGNFTPSTEYMVGYFVAAWIGEGTYGRYEYKRPKTGYGSVSHQVRFAVKETEITDRLSHYMDTLGIVYTKRPYKISTKYNLTVPAIFCCNKEGYERVTGIINENLGKNHGKDYLKGFMAGAYDAEGGCGKDRIYRIANSDVAFLSDLKEGLDLFNIKYSTAQKQSKNVLLTTFSISRDSAKNFIETVQPIRKLGIFGFKEASIRCGGVALNSIEKIQEDCLVYNIETSTHTYIANGLCVHNCYAKTWKRENYPIEKVVNNILHQETKQEGLLPFLIRKRWPITISNRTDVMCAPDWRERLSAIKKLGFPVCMETKLNKDYKDLAQILDPKTDPIYQTITGFNNKYEERNLLSPEEKIEAAKWFVDNGFHFTLAVNPFMPDKVTAEEVKKLIDIIKPHGLVMYDYHKTSKSVHKHLYRPEYPKEEMEAGRKAVSDYCREKGIYHSIGGFESHPYPELNLNLHMNEKFFGGNAIIFQELLIDVISQFTPEFDVFDITFDIFKDFYQKQIKYFDGCIMKDNDYSLGSIRHPFKFDKKRFDFTYFLQNLWNQKKLHFNFDWYSDKFDDEGNLIYFRHKDGFMKEIDKKGKMREHLFRGKHSQIDEWLIGFYYEDRYKNPKILIDDPVLGLRECFVIPETVGQFTGLHDKNGVKIFEGDILLQKTTEKFKEVNPSQWERRYIVRYGYCDFNRGTAGYDTIGFFLTFLYGYEVQKGIGSIERDNQDGYYPYEVIGNIHDNPELLKT